jgi:phosphoglycolate phosphatase-like HAD superfamily hydrolase
LKKTLLLFDIDGTLLRAEDATRQAIIKTFRDIFGIENPIQNFSFSGRTDPGIFRDVALKSLGRPIGDGEYQTVADRYLSFLPGELKRCAFRLMPGVARLLSELSRRTDVILGLETGNIEPAAYLKLKRGDIDHYFSFGGFGSDSEDRTELIRVAIERARKLNNGAIADENIFVIGDSPHDISAGKNTGASTIAVGTGRSDKEKLLAESPTGYLPDLSDINLFMRYVGL